MLCFKFHQNRTINEELDFWRLRGLFWGEVWGLQSFSPGVFCNLHIFAYNPVEFRSIQEECTDVATSCPTIKVSLHALQV